MDVLLTLLALLLDLAPLLAGGALVFLVFLRWEASGQQLKVLQTVLLVLIADCVLFPSYGSSNGVFQPVVAGRSIDLPSLLAVVGVAARLTVRRPPPLLRPAGVLWTFFLLWMVAAGVRGLLGGNDQQTAMNQLLMVIHIGVIGGLAATTPTSQLTGRTGIPRMALIAAPVALLNCVTDIAGLGWYGSLVLFTPSFGQMGADAATAFVSLGLLAVALALVRPVGERAGLVPGALLFTTPLVGSQRAAFLGLGAGLLVLAAGVLLQGRTRPFRLYGGEVVIALVLVACSVAAVAVLSTLTGRVQAAEAVSEQATRTFASTAKQQSAESRRNQWSRAYELAEQAPLSGHGLGVTYVYFEVGPDELRRSRITHNMLLDVGIRAGLVGVLLLVGAVVATGLDGAGVARSRAGPATRALALGALAVLGGLLAKGAVESLFDKHRLSVLLGITIGLVAASRTTASAEPPEEPDGASGDLVAPGAARGGSVARSGHETREADRWT